jgi:hypothetical protein
MTPTTFLDLIKKNGISGLLAVGLFYTNERLNKVEQELYRCYDKMSAYNEVGKRYPKGVDYYAVIPKETSLKSKKHA